MVLRKVLASVLGVSQPDPSWFGNPSNPTNLAGSAAAQNVKRRVIPCIQY